MQKHSICLALELHNDASQQELVSSVYKELQQWWSVYINKGYKEQFVLRKQINNLPWISAKS